jgi:hypothetical protein
MSVVTITYQRWSCDEPYCTAKQTPHRHTKAEMDARTPPRGWVTEDGKDYCPKHKTRILDLALRRTFLSKGGGM